MSNTYSQLTKETDDRFTHPDGWTVWRTYQWIKKDHRGRNVETFDTFEDAEAALGKLEEVAPNRFKLGRTTFVDRRGVWWITGHEMHEKLNGFWAAIDVIEQHARKTRTSEAFAELALPPRFWEDHNDRDLVVDPEISGVVKRNKTNVRVQLTRDDFFELLSDADHYGNHSVYDERDMMGIVASAKATFKRLCKWAAEKDPETYETVRSAYGSAASV